MAQPTSSLLQRSNVSQESPYSNLLSHSKTGKNWSLSDTELRALILRQLLFKLLNNDRLRRERTLLQRKLLRSGGGLLTKRRRKVVKVPKSQLTFSVLADALCDGADWSHFSGGLANFTLYRDPRNEFRSGTKFAKVVKPWARWTDNVPSLFGERCGWLNSRLWGHVIACSRLRRQAARRRLKAAAPAAPAPTCNRVLGYFEGNRRHWSSAARQRIIQVTPTEATNPLHFSTAVERFRPSRPAPRRNRPPVFFLKRKRSRFLGRGWATRVFLYLGAARPRVSVRIRLCLIAGGRRRSVVEARAALTFKRWLGGLSFRQKVIAGLDPRTPPLSWRDWVTHPELFTLFDARLRRKGQKIKQFSLKFKKWRGFGRLLSKNNSAQICVFGRGCLRAFYVTLVGRRLTRWDPKRECRPRVW